MAVYSHSAAKACIPGRTCLASIRRADGVALAFRYEAVAESALRRALVWVADAQEEVKDTPRIPGANKIAAFRGEMVAGYAFVRQATMAEANLVRFYFAA